MNPEKAPGKLARKTNDLVALMNDKSFVPPGLNKIDAYGKDKLQKIAPQLLKFFWN